MTIIWCMVSETRSATDIIFCHSEPFFALLPSYRPRKPKFWKNEKKKKTEGIIILQMCTINDSHIMYDSWDMEHDDRQNFLSFWTIFCTLTPTPLPPFPPHPNNPPKNQNFEKIEKNAWRNYHFTHVYHKWQSYDVWFLRYWVQWIEFFILDQLLAFYPLTTQKI